MATTLRVKRRLSTNRDTSPPRPTTPPPAPHSAPFPPDIDPPVPDRPRLKPGRKTLAERLQLADEGTYYLRDGDVVLFRIPNNRVWQCRYRLLGGGWRRKTTGQRNRIDAARDSCQWFDQARYRQRLGLTAERHLVKTAALETVTELRAELAAGRGRRIYRDYATALEGNLLPFFGERSLDAIRQQHLVEFERWRDPQLGRKPAASTLLPYAAERCRPRRSAYDFPRSWAQGLIRQGSRNHSRCIGWHRCGPVRCFGNAQDGRIGVKEDLPVITVLTIGSHRNHTAHQVEIEQVDLGGRRSGDIWDASDLSA